jgi:hypothetical protein
MSSKIQFSKKILKILSEKKAVSVEELMAKLHGDSELTTTPNPRSCQKEGRKYPIARSMKGLQEAGLVEYLSSGQGDFARLTKEGRKKAHSIKLDGDNAVLNTSWDGYWRIVMLDLPEDRKSEREALRYLLKKAGFVCVKNSVWVSLYPFEHLFANIKKDLDLTTEMMIIVTNTLDEETEKEFLKLLK